MARASRFSSEVKEQAIRQVMEESNEFPSRWSAICSIAGKIGCTSDTLWRWIKRSLSVSQLSTDALDRLNQLERENRELKKTNEILRAAAVYFAKVEFDRLAK